MSQKLDLVKIKKALKDFSVERDWERQGMVKKLIVDNPTTHPTTHIFNKIKFRENQEKFDMS